MYDNADSSQYAKVLNISLHISAIINLPLVLICIICNTFPGRGLSNLDVFPCGMAR